MMMPDLEGLFWEGRATADEVRRALGESGERRLALVRRLLERGEWEEIWSFLTLHDVEETLSTVRLRDATIDSFWREAVAYWRSHPA